MGGILTISEPEEFSRSERKYAKKWGDGGDEGRLHHKSKSLT
jgi:hypothetical protein